VYQGKGTYQLTQNNKFIGYYQWNTKDQPNRLDRFQLNATNAIHLTGDAQFHQHYWPRMSKIEFNSVLSDAMFFEIRAGQWGYNWNDTNYTTATSYEDTSSRIVSGAARVQYTNPRRNQVLGSLSYFKEGMGGTHNLKFGWEIFRQTATTGSEVTSYPAGCDRRPLEHRPVPDRHVAPEQQAHAEPGRPVRPVPELPLRADARGGSVLPRDGRVPGGRQRPYLERAGAPLRSELQPHRRRPHRRQGELGPLLGQPGDQFGQPERQLAEAPCLDRSQRQPRVGLG
jgi:hypothetical protein